jgi:ATP-dependent helicase HrpA
MPIASRAISAMRSKPAPVIEVSGRLYPVENVIARCRIPKDKDRDLMTAITDAVDEPGRIGSGDVLVFLPGEREIRDAAEALRKHHPPHVEILPLFARLSAQERVFKPSNARRIVLATNVAETSLTVPGIRLWWIPVWRASSATATATRSNNYRSNRLQSAANQRRSLRPCFAGVCIRLYDEQEFLQRTFYRSGNSAFLAGLCHFAHEVAAPDRCRNFPVYRTTAGPRHCRRLSALLQELGAMDETQSAHCGWSSAACR